MPLETIDAGEMSEEELVKMFQPTRDKIFNQAEERVKKLGEGLDSLAARIREPLSQIARFTFGL